MLYYDLLNLLNERIEQKPPVMAAEFSYEALPFEEVENRFLEMFMRYGVYAGKEGVFSTEFFELHYSQSCQKLVGDIASGKYGEDHELFPAGEVGSKGIGGHTF